jgi:cytochrome P450
MKVPPGPRGKEVLGFFGRRSPGGTLDFLIETARRYGPISYFRILHRRIYLVDDADLVREILVTQQHQFNRDSGAKLLRELVGDALLTRDEPLHRERRRMLQPAFHKDQIASYADIMVRETRRFAESWRDGTTVDIRAEMRRLTLSIVGASMFGTDFRDSAARVAKVLTRVTSKSRVLAPGITFLEPFADLYRKLWPHGPSLFFRRERKELEHVIAPILAAGRGSSSKDMLALLLNEHVDGQKLDAESVKNELVTFVLAGHETTATALTWTWYLLAKHPAIEARLHEEVDRVLDSEPLSIQTIARLRYTQMVFQESMRLFPPALAYARRPKEDVDLGGYRIPRGSSIFLSPYVTQRNPRYFSDPDEFKPERWESPEIPKFAYFPFGGGAKMCIGEPFARLEGIIVLALLARQFALKNIGSEPVNFGRGLILNPDRSISMRIDTRKIETQANPGTLHAIMQ